MAEMKKTPALRFKGYTEDWEQRKLGELADVKDSARIPNVLWATEGVPYIRASDVSNNDLTGVLFLETKTFSNYKNKTGAPEKGDVLFNGGGEIGKALLKLDQSPIYVQGGAVLYAKTSRSKILNGKYLLAYFQSSQAKNYINSSQAGGTMKHFTLGPAQEMPITYPNWNEQEQIGLFFSNLDNLITLHQRELEKLQIFKKSMLENMFPKNGEKVPKIRFSGFTDDWEQCKLGDLMNVGSVKRVHESDWRNSGVRFLRARDIVAEAKNEKPDDYLYIDEKMYAEYSAISGKVVKDDLLVTGVGTIGVPMLIKSNNPVYFKDGNIIWFKNNNVIDGNFFYYSFCSNTIQAFIKESAGTGTVGTYTIESGKVTPITLPVNKDEQKQIGQLFSKINYLITLHQRELEKLQNLKKALLEKMLI